MCSLQKHFILAYATEITVRMNLLHRIQNGLAQLNLNFLRHTRKSCMDNNSFIPVLLFEGLVIPLLKITISSWVTKSYSCRTNMLFLKVQKECVSSISSLTQGKEFKEQPPKFQGNKATVKCKEKYVVRWMANKFDRSINKWREEEWMINWRWLGFFLGVGESRWHC